MKLPLSVPPLIPTFSPQGEKELKPKFVGIYDAVQSRHPSLSTVGILRLSERCLSEASFANAQNTGERKEPRKARRGIRVAFLLVTFLWPHKEK